MATAARRARVNQYPEPKLPTAMETALAKQGWKRRDQPPLKFEKGIEVQGVFVKLVPSTKKDMSPVLHVDTLEGRVRYWCPAILEQRVQDFQEGEEIFIVCLGKDVPIPGRSEPAWGFDVFGK